ncbi:MAG: hypothetical protein IT323_22820 [Anaerolineae bacterium]|nr:hypothetical protein [Anaerolineae bacterium]
MQALIFSVLAYRDRIVTAILSKILSFQALKTFEGGFSPARGGLHHRIERLLLRDGHEAFRISMVFIFSVVAEGVDRNENSRAFKNNL